MSGDKKKIWALSTAMFILIASWIYAAAINHQEKQRLNLQADATYFGEKLPEIKIGNQLCKYSGIDEGSKKNMYLCEDGQYYIHNDWH